METGEGVMPWEWRKRTNLAPVEVRRSDRYLGDGKNFVKIGAPHTYRPGDVVFFSTSNNTVASEGLYVGKLKSSPDVLILVIGKQFVETLEKECAPTGQARPAEGASWRRAYLKEHPGTLT